MVQDGTQLEQWDSDLAEQLTKLKGGRRIAWRAMLCSGRILSEAHADIEHGHWGPFLEKHGLSGPTAWRYMALHSFGVTVDEIEAAGGVSKCFKLKQMEAQLDEGLRRKAAAEEDMRAGGQHVIDVLRGVRERLEHDGEMDRWPAFFDSALGRMDAASIAGLMRVTRDLPGGRDMWAFIAQSCDYNTGLEAFRRVAAELVDWPHEPSSSPLPGRATAPLAHRSEWTALLDGDV